MQTGSGDRPSCEHAAMEKLIYLLWSDGDRADTARLALDELAPALLALDPPQLSMDVADPEGEFATPLPPDPADPPPTVAVSLWLPTLDQRGPFEERLAAAAGRHAGYLVTESIPTEYGQSRWSGPRDWPDGQRSPGPLLLTLMEQPERLSYEAWLAHWYGVQTPMSTAIQPRIRYVRNAVVRPVTADAPPYRGIVEEVWPSSDDIEDPMRFYLADGDDDLLARNMTTMVESVTAFLDMDRIRLAAMSEHLLKTWWPTGA